MPEKGHTRDARYYAGGIARGDIATLGKAITFMESSRPDHQALAREILSLLPRSSGPSFRLGITGVPGVGKSTFIESFGMHVLDAGHRLAVLAVDPSSARSGGSILGDKTRMTRLSARGDAFIRPSPSSGTLGGLARATYGSIALCEAAGFDFVIVETVGVGQSEVAVSRVTDFFLLLMLAGAGDELQGIKRGIMEMADAIVITKADGGNEKKAAAARAEFARAVHLLQPSGSGWTPPVMTCSAIADQGIKEVLAQIKKFYAQALESGFLMRHRHGQQMHILEEMLNSGILGHFYERYRIKDRLAELAERADRFDPFAEAHHILRQAGLA